MIKFELDDYNGKYSSTTYLRRFGTRTPANIPEEDLFKNLEETWIKIGRQPRYQEIQKPLSKYHVNLEIGPSTRHKTKRNINWRLRFIAMRRDNFKCKKCGRSPATDPTIILHVDHKTAWANGGETVLENLETLCSKCNIGKSNIE